MALYTFYNGYQIDDQDIDCGRIIQVRCDNVHEYVDPCTLLQSCLLAWPAIDRCGMIPGIVAGQPGIPTGVNAGWFLRVNLAGSCVEFVDPCTILTGCGIDDVNVKVSNTDTTTGKLITKIVSCNPAALSITIGNPGANETLILCPSFCSTFLCLSDVPDAYPVCASGEGAVKFNAAGVFFECDRNYWFEWYRGTDFSISQATNTIEFYTFATARAFGGSLLAGPMNDPHGNPVMNGGGGTIVIPETGMYRVRLKGQALVDDGVQAIRLSIISNNPARDFVLDSKRGGQDAPASPLIPPTVQPVLAQRTKGFYDFNATNLIRLNQGEILAMGCRIDANAGTNQQADVTWFHSVLGGGTYNLPAPNPTNLPGLSFGVSRYCKSVFNAQ